MRRVVPLVSAILLVVPTSLTSAANTASRIEVAGITRIAGHEPGYVSVHIPQTIRIRNPLFGGDDVQIQGRGEFVGFALVPQFSSDYAHALLGGRLPKSAGRRRFLFNTSSFFADSESRTRLHVHKGDYRLYLLPGEGYAQITLRFDGLQGSLELHPQSQVQYEAHVPKPKYATPGNNYYSAGHTASLGGRGLVFGTVWMNTALHGVTHADVCF